jgi:electron transfer flavoprotein alpha subunit
VAAILVLVEAEAGRPSTTSLELVGAARRLAERVEALSSGPGAEALAATLGEHGVATLWHAGELGSSLAAPTLSAALAERLRADGEVEAILVPATYDGRDAAGRLSARIDRPVLANVVGLERVEGRLVAEHAIFGGTKLVRSRFTGEGPGIFLVRAKSFPVEPTGGPPAEVRQLSVAPTAGTDRAEVLGRHAEEQSGPRLDDADVVVSGGRGLGTKENFALVEELARLLNGAPGASRAVVDAGWVPYAYQVGQTGKTVKPTLYVAVGISGATQHLVGMKGSSHILAINKDPDAPIFSVADLGVVADATSLVPRLIDALKALPRRA